MEKILCSAVLVLLVHLSSGQLLSPCPDVFSYERDEDGSFGAINVPSKNIGDVLNLTVSLRFENTLPSKFKGFVQLKDSFSDIYEIMHNGVQPVTYKLKFPSTTDVFYIEQIAINDTIVCTGYWPQNARYNIILLNDFEFSSTHRIRSYTVKSFVFKNDRHSLSTGKDFIKRESYDEPPPSNSDRPHFDDYIRAPKLPNKEPLKYTRAEVNSACGKVSKKIHSRRENWPWLSGIYRRDVTQLTIVSGATLISEDTVVAAAQSIATLNNRPIRREELGIRVGLYDLTAWSDESSKMQAVYKIIFHPQFNPNSLIMDNNIALLKMQPVVFSSYIKPICLTDRILPNDDSSLVEWDRRDIPNIAFELKLSLTNNNDCQKNSLFKKIATENTVCARSSADTKWCTENQGSGLYIKRKARSYLAAILSYSFKAPNKECGVRRTRVFTDVTKYYDWINDNWYFVD